MHACNAIPFACGGEVLWSCEAGSYRQRSACMHVEGIDDNFSDDTSDQARDGLHAIDLRLPEVT
eukprot:3142198-Pleurochrysis_carterae.AAC.1